MSVFWEDRIEWWSKSTRLPTRLVCVVDDEKELAEIEDAAPSFRLVSDERWTWFPERRQVIAGLRDDVFSRALDFGYGVKEKYRHLQFGLINNDALWLVKRPCRLWNRVAATQQKGQTFNLVHGIRADHGLPVDINGIHAGRITPDDAGLDRLMERPPPIENYRRRQCRSRAGWVPLRDHLDMTVAAASLICSKARPRHACSVITAARYHDIAKSHPCFQEAVKRGHDDIPDPDTVWAKSPFSRSFDTNGYFHDLVGGAALASCTDMKLESYLVMTHHGHFHSAIPDVDESLPATDLGAGVSFPATDFTIKPEDWTALYESLVAEHGPFILSYLEALLRASDMRSFLHWNDRAAMKVVSVRRRRRRHRTSRQD